ncbi:MAG: triose-phosphate isomerase [Bacteroidetes bacterium]|nr:triose-phosphate isomerase [Bacteroidota bacterium]
MRKLIAAGNWKMNLTATEAWGLVGGVLESFADNNREDVHVLFAPSYPFLSQVVELAASHDRVHVAAQNLYQEESGAFTGEVSASQLVSIGVTHVLIGHSERRQYFGESNQLLAKKVDIALAHGLTPVYCFGETLEEREAGNTLSVNKSQISEGLFHLSEESFKKVILAYEPVWAIGTGKTASPEQAQEVHQYLRGLVRDQYSDATANDTTILYGGSVKPDNAAELFAKADIDGGLVGGASLKAGDFAEIIKGF